MPKPLNSSVVIGRLLASSGYTEHLAGLITRYEQRCVLSPRQCKQFRRLKEAVGKFMATASEGDRAVMGKFIAYQKRMSFDTGLRVGLAAFAASNGGTKIASAAYEMEMSEEEDGASSQSVKQEPPQGETPQAAEGEAKQVSNPDGAAQVDA